MSRSASNQLPWHFGWRRSVTGGCAPRLELAPPRGYKGLVPRVDDRSRGVGSDQTGY